MLQWDTGYNIVFIGIITDVAGHISCLPVYLHLVMELT